MAQRSRGERVLGPYPIGRQMASHRGRAQEAKEIVASIRMRGKGAEKVIRSVGGSSRGSGGRDDAGSDGSSTSVYLSTTSGTSPGRWRTPCTGLECFSRSTRRGRCCWAIVTLEHHACEGSSTRRSGRGRPKTASCSRWTATDDSRGGEDVPAVVRGEEEVDRREIRWTEVKGVGKRRHGKSSSGSTKRAGGWRRRSGWRTMGRRGRWRRWCALLMGMRASEMVSRVVRDLDDEGRLLWIPDSKTEAGRRKLQVPELLQPYLQGAGGGDGHRGGAVRGALAGLAAEVGAADLQGGGRAEGDRARDAGAALRRWRWTAGSPLTRSRRRSATSRSRRRPRATRSARRWRARSSGGC